MAIDLAAREARGQDLRRRAVAPGLPERRHEHRAVDDEKVSVAGRQPVPVARNRAPGIGSFTMSSRPPAGRARGRAGARGFLRRARWFGSRRSRSTASRLPVSLKKRVRSSTCPSVSSPAMPFAQPEDLAHAEEAPQVALDLGPGERAGCGSG